MSLLRDFRSRHGLRQVDVAERAGVKQASVAQYESGARSPSLGRFRKILGAFGQDVAIVPDSFVPAHDRTELSRQLLHMRVAERFVARPEVVRSKALSFLDRVHPGGTYSDEWRRLLEPGNEIDLIVTLTVPSEANSGLLTASPFPGVLTAQEREQVLAQAKRSQRGGGSPARRIA